MSLDRRLAGLLLHPTSLPGPYGIGDLGPECTRFLDWMRDAGLAYWQVLPLGPTGYGDSPYQSFSAFAGNPLLVSPEVLMHEGLLTHDELVPPAFPLDRVDYGWVIPWKRSLLEKAFERYRQGGLASMRVRFEAFIKRPDIALWLEDYALYMACKDAHGGRPWNEWEEDLCAFKARAVKQARKDHADQIEFYRFAQFLFFDQWEGVRAAGRERAIEIIGDAPIYVAYDSADTWANQDLFELDKTGKPIAVAGVPPDYFSRTGQLWGNPLYNWKKMEKDGYAWWIARIKAILSVVDVVRIDHFRGFMGYYAVPFGEQTAENGDWVKGPGAGFFSALEKEFGAIPIIAEDLGEISDDVFEVRDQFNLPGMKVLHFAWSVADMNPVIPNPNHKFLPHRIDRNTVVYTGTHDNDTTLGWWRNSSTPEERMCMQVYLATDGNAANWDMIRAAFASVANTAVAPTQDVLGLGSEARMNMPGSAEGNWTWRLRHGQLTPDLASRIRTLTLLYDRCSNPPEKAIPDAAKKPLY